MPADQQRRTGSVGDRAVRAHRGLAAAEVQGRTRALVSPQYTGVRFARHDPRCDQGDLRITEVPQHDLQPTGARHHIRVQEGDEFRCSGE